MTPSVCTWRRLKRFDDEVDPYILNEEGRAYFANILLPYAALVTKLLAKVGDMDLPLKAIATDHGPVWRKDIAGVLTRYGAWAAQQRTNSAVILFDTMWQSTAKMAQAVSEGLLAGGAEVKVFPLSGSHRSDIATALLDAGAILVGSPTLNNNLFPTVADVLTYLKGLRPQNLVGAAFGSYGWGGEAVGQVRDILTAMKVEMVGDTESQIRARRGRAGAMLSARRRCRRTAGEGESLRCHPEKPPHWERRRACPP